MPPRMGQIAPITTSKEVRGSSGYRPYNPVQGVGTGQGGLADLVMQIFAQDFLKSRDMFGAGLGGGNMYNRMQSQRLQASHDEMLKEAAKQDEDTAYRLQLGFNTAAGQYGSGGPNVRQEAQLRADAKKIAEFGPTAVQIAGPGLVDRVGGSRGMNVSMAEHMFQGGQFKMDPVTGRLTMGTQSAIDLNKQVYETLFKGQSGASRTHGMSAGDVGSMFHEMQRAGLMRGGTITTEDLLNDSGKFSNQHNKAVVDALLNIDKDLDVGSGVGGGSKNGIDAKKIRERVAELTPANQQKLAEDTGVATSVKIFDASRTSKTLEDYSQALGAMREIFGDANRPNAPIPALINSLNQLTGGALTQINPGQLNTMVRETWNLAQNAGIGLEGLTMLSEVATQQVREAGVNDIHTMQVVQTGLAFRDAYAKGDHVPHFGLSNINVLAMKAQQRHVAAVKSTAYNIGSTALRIQDTAGGFDEGSEAEAYANAIRRGHSEFTYKGNTRSIGAVRADEFASMAAEGTRNKAQYSIAGIFGLLGQKKTNDLYGQKYDVAAPLVPAQAAELFSDEHLPTTLGYRAQLIAKDGGFGRESVAIGTFVGRAAAKTIQGLAPADRTEETGPASITAGVIAELESAAAGTSEIPGLDRATAARYLAKMKSNKAFAARVGSEIYGSAAEYTESGNAPTGVNTLADTLAIYDEETRTRSQAVRAKSRAQRIVQDALGGVGYDGIRSGLDAVMNYDGTTKDAVDVFAEAMGGHKDEDIAKKLRDAGVFEKLQAAKKGSEKAAKEYESAEKGSPEAIAAGKRMDAADAEYEKIANDVRKILKDEKYEEDELTPAESKKEKRRQRGILRDSKARAKADKQRAKNDKEEWTDDEWDARKVRLDDVAFEKEKELRERRGLNPMTRTQWNDRKAKREDEEDEGNEKTASKGVIEIKIEVAKFEMDGADGGKVAGVGTVSGLGGGLA